MFIVEQETVAAILRDYHIESGVQSISELRRYHYEKDDPDSKEVRLIVKVEFADRSPVVMRFKNEEDVTQDLMESQCSFAEILRANGILTPLQYKSNGSFANWYSIDGYDVIVTVEDFAENEVKTVDERAAYKTGKMLAETHNISEQNNLHLQYDVLFNPFKPNDLFFYEDFLEIKDGLNEENGVLFQQIVDKYKEYMSILAPLKKYPSYAVQGDISDCNLYLSTDGRIGLFDYNNAGDNILYCDAVMQAVFEAKLMDYPQQPDEAYSEKILSAFLKGYVSVRRFTEEEKSYYPYLYAIISAFWGADIRWNDDSLINAHAQHDEARVHQWLTVILQRLSALPSVQYYDESQ